MRSDSTVQYIEKNRWKSPLKMTSEKGYGCSPAVWSLFGGLMRCDLKNSRAVSLNNDGLIAISRNRDLPNPDILWNPNTNELEEVDFQLLKNKGKEAEIPLKVNVYNHMNGILDTNGKSSLVLQGRLSKDPELHLVTSEKYRVVPLPNLYIKHKRTRTGFPSVNVCLNDNDKVIAMVNVDGKQAIATWDKSNGVIVSGCLQDNPHFKGFTNFEIVGFNNNEQILLRADIGEIDQIEYNPFKPCMYLLTPKSILIKDNV
jgi:hypothetical protein